GGGGGGGGVVVVDGGCAETVGVVWVRAAPGLVDPPTVVMSTISAITASAAPTTAAAMRADARCGAVFGVAGGYGQPGARPKPG
ncbi:hypothetical protein OSH80_12960, partial [Mycobacterium ulcerans]